MREDVVGYMIHYQDCFEIKEDADDALEILNWAICNVDPYAWIETIYKK
jgi:hypothetical protein